MLRRIRIAAIWATLFVLTYWIGAANTLPAPTSDARTPNRLPKSSELAKPLSNAASNTAPYEEAELDAAVQQVAFLQDATPTALPLASVSEAIPAAGGTRIWSPHLGTFWLEGNTATATFTVDLRTAPRPMALNVQYGSSPATEVSVSGMGLEPLQLQLSNIPFGKQVVKVFGTIGGKDYVGTFTVVVPDLSAGHARPSITGFANSPQQTIQSFTSGTASKVYGDNGYIRLSGQGLRPADELRFFFGQGDPTKNIFEIKNSLTVSEFRRASSQNNAWDAVTRLPELDGRLWAVALRDDLPLFAPEQVTVDNVNVGAVATTTALNIVDTDGAQGATLYSNKPEKNITVKFADDATKFPVGSDVVVRRNGSREVLGVKRVEDAATALVEISLSGLGDGENRIYAQIEQGGVELAHGKSETVSLWVRRGGLRVIRVGPSGFGSLLGVNKLKVQFDTANPLKIVVNGNGVITQPPLVAFELIPSGGTGRFEGAGTVNTVSAIHYEKGTNTLELSFATAITADLYRLRIIPHAELTDVYGNRLEGQIGVEGSEFTIEVGRIPADNVAENVASVGRGIRGATGPYVPYTEFTAPRNVPDGFNPNDKVETRVVRLYYFRDAHRVAQIVNRKVQSFNRHGVDMQRQIADRARLHADQVTAERQRSERSAIVAAQETRRKETELAQAEQAYNRSLTELQGAIREGAEPTDPIVSQLESTARAFADKIETARSAVESARQTEVVANERSISLDSDEQRARDDQFRRERAAGHEDPDTYAAGNPHSDDPIEQVSVSVIGEGLIHLRGPLKGINQIRIMIDQIDSPVGQVRVSIHSTQVNGDQGDNLEIVAGRIQQYIDQSRFLTVQSGELLRRAVGEVAAMRAEEARLNHPGNLQADRDQRYLFAFFGHDFIHELHSIDSEFLHTGNKLLALHSMDTTSLSSALMLLALANNDTRMAILARFDELLQSELTAAEQHFINQSIICTQEKQRRLHFKCKDELKIYQLAPNARFQSLRGFFETQLNGIDTITPIQREFIRLAQIFKSRLITEMEYKQRVMERAIVEERLGNRLGELELARRKEAEAQQQLAEVNRQRANARQNAIAMLTQTIAILQSSIRDIENLRSTRFNVLAKDILDPEHQRAANDFRDGPLRKLPGMYVLQGTEVEKAQYTFEKDVNNHIRIVVKEGDPLLFTRTYVDAIERVRKMTTIIGYYADVTKLQKAADALHAKDLNRQADRSGSRNQLYYDDVVDLATVFTLANEQAQDLFDLPDHFNEEKRELFHVLADSTQTFEQYYERWTAFRMKLRKTFAWHPSAPQVAVQLERVDNEFAELLRIEVAHQFLQREAQAALRPLDYKKFLDMLIDDLEDKYIELLEGTRARTATVDNYIKRITTALDDDFNTQFYNPTFRFVREASQYRDVTFGQTESTSVLANNRSFAKVSPSATMEFDMPARDMLLTEAINGGLAMYKDLGALANDPNLLALASMKSGQSGASMVGGSQGGVVRSVLPGLSSDTSEQIMSQNSGQAPGFGSNLENLIPDPAIYKFETGTGYEIRPVIEPDGQAVVFDFEYLYRANIREPVRADEKHLGRVKQHYIDTDVQLSNFELREVSKYVIALRASRTAKGVPLLEDIPLIGALWKPLPSDEKSLQQNIVMAQATIFPTLFDLMGLRYAPSVADLDPLRLSNREFVVRGRNQFLENRVYDFTSSQVDEFMRIPEELRRPDLYRSQATIGRVHPNGYEGRGLDYQRSTMQNFGPSVPGMNMPRLDLPGRDIPGGSADGSLMPTRRWTEPQPRGGTFLPGGSSQSDDYRRDQNSRESSPVFIDQGDPRAAAPRTGTAPRAARRTR